MIMMIINDDDACDENLLSPLLQRFHAEGELTHRSHCCSFPSALLIITLVMTVRIMMMMVVVVIMLMVMMVVVIMLVVVMIVFKSKPGAESQPSSTTSFNQL